MTNIHLDILHVLLDDCQREKSHVQIKYFNEPNVNDDTALHLTVEISKNGGIKDNPELLIICGKS